MEEFYMSYIFRSLLRPADSLLHGLIGGFSYWLACIICPELLLRVPHHTHTFQYLPQLLKAALLSSSMFSFAVSFFVACAVDLDHVVFDAFQLITVSIGMVGI